MSSKLLNYPSASSTTSAHSRFVNNSSSAVASSSVAGSCSLNYDNLQLDDILCPVCSSVLVEPVYLPCQHLFCRHCLSETIEKNKLNCPCCRKRFGTWYRNASRVNKLVHERLWQAIQSQFRDHLAYDGALGSVKGCAASSAPQMNTCYLPPNNQTITLANPGEIRREYTSELKQYQKQRHEEATKELVATEQCIINLYKQEGIIDLADNSSHVSVSSTTTPDQHDGVSCERVTKVSNATPMAGPSSLCYARREAPEKKQNSSQISKKAMHKGSAIIESQNLKSPSNGSVISISSTSSAASAVTASSCASSSASGRYSLLKSVVQQIGRSAEIVKQKVQGNILHRLTGGKLQNHQKSLCALDLNKSVHCVKPTVLHKVERRGVKDDDEDGVDDTDSLKSEQNHFIPIIASLPKTSFSLDTVVRVPPVRPIPSPVTYTLTPKKSPCWVLQETVAHQSAFSVVNLTLLSPLRNPHEEESGMTLNSECPIKTPTSTQRRGRRRRMKLKFTPTKGKKAATRNINPEGSAGSSNVNVRTSRRPAEARRNTIRHIIVSDQQRREQQIEMERRDFEFAQKLQEKLNRSSGIMQEIHRQYPAPRSTGYSLRRKGTANDTLNESLNSSCVGSGDALNCEAATLSPEENGKKKTPAKKTRKRKATSSSVENDVPSSSSPGKQIADQTKPRQTRQSRKNSLNQGGVLDAASSTEGLSIPQRKSARNKAR